MPPDGTQEVSRIIAAAEEITLDPTVPASPSDALGEDDEIARLAALSLLAYEQEREAAAQRLARDHLSDKAMRKNHTARHPGRGQPSSIAGI
jgi:hypothetical protein